MKDLIVAVVLYLFAIGMFRWLGGFASAGEALRDWGSATAAKRTSASSSSY